MENHEIMRKLQDELERSRRELAALRLTVSGLMQELDQEKLLAELLYKAAELSNCTHGYLFLLDPEDDRYMKLVIGIGNFSWSKGVHIHKGQYLAGEVWETGEAVFVDQYQEWENKSYDPRFATIESLVSVPVRVYDQVIGVLSVASTEKGRSLQGEMKLLVRFSEMASALLANAQLYQRLQLELQGKQAAEASLQEQVTFFQTLMNAVPGPIYYKSRDGICRGANQAFFQLTGKTIANTVGEFMDEASLYVDETGSLALLDDILYWRGGPQVFDAAIRTPISGEMRNVSVYREVYRDREGEPQGIVAAILDVTSKKQIQTALQRSVAILQGVLESSGDGILAVQRDGEEYRVVAANQKFCEMFDLPEEFIRSVSAESGKEKGMACDLYHHILNSLYHDTQQNGRDVIKLANQKVLEMNMAPFQVEGELLGKVETFRDITDQHRAEMAVRESNERLKALADQSFDGIFTLDPETLLIEEANNQFLKIMGYDLEEIRRRKVYDVVDSDRETVDRNIQLTRKNGRHFIGVRQYKRRNGAPVKVEVAAAWVSYKQKQVVQVNVRDVTERQRMEDQIMAELELAAKVQQEFLPAASRGKWFSTEFIYSPQNGVSGDIVGLTWKEEEKKLFGFVIDISGHGVATALRSTVLLMLTRQVANQQASLADRVRMLNAQAIPWFMEDSFAAAIFFEFDFAAMELRYVPAGAGYFLVSSRELQGMVETPGFLLGMFQDAEFEEYSVPIFQGDSFYFLSDGISDLLRYDDWQARWGKEFTSNVAMLRRVVGSERRRDDASAFCLIVNHGDEDGRLLKD